MNDAHRIFAFLTISQFRHVTESNLTGPQDLLNGCPTLLEEQGTSEEASQPSIALDILGSV